MSFYITRCPYCNKVLRMDYGIERFYKYENKTGVTINSHYGCGAFIQQPIDDITWARYDISDKFRRAYLYCIEECVFEQFSKSKLPSEDEMLNQVIEYLNSKNGGNHDYDEITANLQSIKITIEVIVGQINLGSIFSEPLTEEVKNKLVFEGAVCCD